MEKNTRYNKMLTGEIFRLKQNEETSSENVLNNFERALKKEDSQSPSHRCL